MKYYILYEDYSEYNQFEGYWELRKETFTSLMAAKKAIKNLKGDNNNYRHVIGPLIHTCNLKNINPT